MSKKQNAIKEKDFKEALSIFLTKSSNNKFRNTKNPYE